MYLSCLKCCKVPIGTHCSLEKQVMFIFESKCSNGGPKSQRLRQNCSFLELGNFEDERMNFMKQRMQCTRINQPWNISSLLRDGGMRPWVKDLHASPLNYPKKLFVESMANIHTDNVYPERPVLRRLGLGIRPLIKFDVVDTLEQHKNPSNTVRRW